jgi:hypothetical protein
LSEGPNFEDLEIKKKTYSFSQKKRYSPTSRFVVKKGDADTPLKRALQNVFGKEIPFSKQKKSSQQHVIEKKKPSGPSPLVFGGLLLFILICSTILWLLFTVPMHPPGPSGSGGDLFVGTAEMQVFESGILTYGVEGAEIPNQAYLIMDHQSANLSELNITFKLYSQVPSRQVFLLNYPLEGADSYADFQKHLYHNILQHGWVINQIRIEDLDNLPAGSTVIIPTGLFPAPLAKLNDRGIPKFMEIISKGSTFIYIGQSLSDALMSESANPELADVAALEEAGIIFNPTSGLSSSGGFRMKDPLYSVSKKKSSAHLIWGSISKFDYGRGSILFVPETLDAGWRANGKEAGEDIARLVVQEPFRSVIVSKKIEYPKDKVPDKKRETIYFDPMIQSSANMRVIFDMMDSKGTFSSKIFDWPIKKTTNGNLYLKNPVFIPVYLGGSNNMVIADLKEPQEQKVKLFYELFKNGTSQEKLFVEQGLTNVNIPKVSSIKFNQDPGDYILRVTDSSDNVYAESKITMVGIDIAGPEGKDLRDSFDKKSFDFNFISKGSPISIPKVTVHIKELSSTKREYKYKESITYTTDEDFKKGDYTFVFDFDRGFSKEYTIKYAPPEVPWLRADVIILGVIGVLIFVAGFVFRLQPKAKFSLDIPDFPPASHKIVKMNTSDFIDVFEKVNKDYVWNHMPLSIEEIKSGFRKVNSHGKSIIVGDFNLQRVLEQLEDKGVMEQSLGFFAPVRWAEQSGIKIEVLAMFRYLRNLFVQHAIRFSKLRAVKECDIKFLLGNNSHFIHLYSGDDSLVENAIKTAAKGDTWILFKDHFELETFKKKMRSSSTLFLSLKMQVDAQNIKLYSIEQMDEIFKKLKYR